MSNQERTQRRAYEQEIRQLEREQRKITAAETKEVKQLRRQQTALQKAYDKASIGRTRRYNAIDRRIEIVRGRL
jgi:hypothetical protein